MATLNSGKAAFLWRQLVSENPMSVEVGRFRRRFLEGTRSRNLNTTILVLALVAYASLMVVLSNMSGELSPNSLIFVQTGVFVLLAPTFMYSAIAGEREKRTWDLLLAAPVTHAQIAVGKFLAGLAGLGATLVLFILPTLFTSFTFDNERNYMVPDSGVPLAHGVSGTAAFANEEFISITFGIMLLAATLLFSARCRRSLMSLSVMLISLFAGLLAFPALITSFAYADAGNAFMDVASFFHPFLAIEKIEELHRASVPQGMAFGLIQPWGFGVLQGILYLALTAVFLVWACKTVNFADGEKKFMPGKRNA